MNSEVKIDILFAGLLLIPVLILTIPYIKNKLISLTLHSAAFLGINFLIDAAHAINDNTVPLLYI